MCIHNPAIGREARLPHVITPADTQRKVVVVGGGVAGLEAARVSAERGHQVVLFEASDQLGGQINLAAKVRVRQALREIVAWRVAEMGYLGVDVRLGQTADEGMISAEKPDAIIIATGGTPYFSDFSGAEQCHSVWDALNNSPDYAGRDVLIYDGIGQHQAPSCATHLATHGARINYVTIDAQLAEEMGGSERVMHRKRFQQHGIPVHIDLQIHSVEKAGDKLKATFKHELTDTLHSFIADHIIIEQGTQPTADLYHAMRDDACNKGVTDIKALLASEPQPQRGAWETGYELHRIGNAVSSRAIHSAVLDALRLCHTL